MQVPKWELGTKVLLLECLAMSEATKFKLYVFRYSDNVISGESANLAICLVEDSDHPDRFVGFEIIKDWSRVKGFFPNADVEFLKSWCHDLANQLNQAKGSADLFSTLENCSGNIAVSVDSQALLSHKRPNVEMKFLTHSYLR
jgi:hypothetical protein